MSKVRVPVHGTVGKSVRVNPDATDGAQLGVNLYDENGDILTLDALLGLVTASAPEETNTSIFEEQIIDGSILARTAANEIISGQYTFENRVDIDNGNAIRIHDTTDALYANFQHGVADFNASFVGTANWNITGLSGRIFQGAETLAYVSEIEANFSGLGEWLYRTELVAPPASGQIRFNNAIVRNATEFYLHETNNDGADMSGFFDILLNPGAVLYIQDKTTAETYITIEVGTSVDNGTYRTFQIDSVVDVLGSPPPQDTPLMLVATSGVGLGGFLPGPTVAGSSLRSDGTTGWLEQPQVQFSASGVLSVHDGTLASSIAVSHDGADANLVGTGSVDLNVSGFTAIQAGTVDLDVDALTATSYGGILEANLVDKTIAEIISGSWNHTAIQYFTGATNALRVANDSRIIALNAASSANVNLAYLTPTDVVTFGQAGYTTNILGSAITIGGRSVAADGAKLDGIESGATADQTAGEIEAIVNHDNLLGFVANEHIDWTADQGGTQINVNNLGPDQMSTTPRSNVIQYNRWGANQDMAGTTNWDVGAYGGYNTMTNGPTGMTYDPFLVLGSSSDVRSFLVLPRTASRALAYKGSSASGASHTAWHYAAWTTTAADADLSLYAKTGAIVAGDIDAEASLDGYVLTSDGLGNAAWEAAGAGSQTPWTSNIDAAGYQLLQVSLMSIDNIIPRAGQQLILNAGEAYSYATGQTAEYVYLNAEQGLQVNTSPDNWATLWAGRNTSTLTGESLTLDSKLALDVQTNWLYVGGGFTSGTYIAAGQLQTNGAIRSNTGQYYGVSGNEMIRGNDTWVRLNPSSNYSSGVYTPGDMRVDGDLYTADPIFGGYNYVQPVYYNQVGFDYWGANNSAAVTAGSWYTIATDPSTLDITTTPVGKAGASRAAARFRIWDVDSGQHSFCEFEVSVTYGRRPTVTLINRSAYGSKNTGVRGIRIVRYSTYNGHAVQIQAGHTGTLYCSMQQLHTGGFHARDFLAQTPEATWYVEEYDNNAYTEAIGFGVSTGVAVGADNTHNLNFAVTGSGVHVGDPEAFFEPVTGNYGGVQVSGSAGSTGTWSGYSIDGEYVFMSYSGAGRCGIYNDVDNEWMQEWDRNAGTEIYYNGVVKLRLASSGTHVLGGDELRVYDTGNDDHIYMEHNATQAVIGTAGTGAGAVDISMRFSGTERAMFRSTVTTGETSYMSLDDHAGNLRDVGFNDSRESRTNTSFTFAAEDAGNVAVYSNGSSYNATLAASTNLDFPVGARMDIINYAAGTINVNQGTGTTLYWADGDGAMATGNRDLGYGWCTIWRRSSTQYFITGNGIT